MTGSLGISVVTAIYNGDFANFRPKYPHLLGASRQFLKSHFQAFISREIKEYIKNSGTQVIGYRKLRDAVRG